MMAYDHEQRAGFVYFIQETELKNIKIGFTSSHPAKRMSTLSAASSQELVFLGFMLGDKKKEQRLHQKFRHLHIRNEWFAPGEDLLAFISALEYGEDFEKALAGYVNAP